jgi:hypothetical protein
MKEIDGFDLNAFLGDSSADGDREKIFPWIAVDPSSLSICF